MNSAFKNILIAIVKSMAKSNDSEEIKCMIEALTWKYHGDDHAFLSEINLFGILRGQDDDSLLRKAWGKSVNTSIKEIFTILKQEDSIDYTLVKKLAELFEIAVILCVGKLKGEKEETAIQQNINFPKKNAFPSLERHVSAVDEYSAEILLRQAFVVIFQEFENADMNYKGFEGLDWGCWLRALIRKKRKDENERKKKKGKPQKQDYQYGEDEFYEEGQDEEEEEEEVDKKSDKESDLDDENKEIYNEIQEDQEMDEPDYDLNAVQFGEVWDLKTGRPVNRKKDGEKAVLEVSSNKMKEKMIKEMMEKEEKLLNDKLYLLYNPEFLQRMLNLLFKCVAVGLDEVTVVIGNPKYLGILFSLLLSSSPSHRILILKITSFLFKTLPCELFVDSILECLRKNPKFFEEKELSNLKNQKLVVSFFFKLLINIRKLTFTENIEFEEEYTISCELISLLRDIMKIPAWTNVMKDLIKNCIIEEKEYLQKMLAISLIGGEFNGLRYGGKILVNSNNDDLFDSNVLLKQNLNYPLDTATIVGFSNDYKDKISEEDKKKLCNDDPRFKISISLGNIEDERNPIVIVDSTIPKSISSLNALELSSVYRFNSIAIDSIPFEPSLYEIDDSLLDLFKWSVDPSNLTIAAPKNAYIKSLTLKCLENYLKNDNNIDILIRKNPNLCKNLMQLACEKVISQRLINLEISEERIHRLIKSSVETKLDLSELKSVSATISKNELEVLLGKDFATIKLLIYSGYQLGKINYFYELINFKEITKDIIEKPKDYLINLKEFIGNKGLVINYSDLRNNEFFDIACLAKFVITHDFDILKLAEEMGENLLEKKKEPKKEKKDIIKNKEKNSEIKVPNCIVNLAEKLFLDLESEINNQRNKEYVNIYKTVNIIDELADYGFPRDMCEEYVRENPQENLDTIIVEIAKKIEQKDSQDNNQALITDDDEQEEEDEEEEGEDGEEEGEEGEEKEEKECKEENEEIKEEEEDIDKNEEDEDENDEKFNKNVLKKNKKKKGKKLKENNDEKNEIFNNIENSKNSRLKSENLEKEEPNTCFKCKGEKEMQYLLEEKNSLYDILIDFEGLNKIDKIILFDKTNYNLGIYYARRSILRLFEIWPEDVENFLLKDVDLMLKFLKFICFEGIFSSASFCNNILLNRVCNLFNNYFEKNDKIKEFNDKIFENFVLEPIFNLEKRYVINENKSGNGYIGKLNNEEEIELASLDFSLKIAELFMKSKNKLISKKMVRLDLLYSILGLITVIKQNKFLGWGVMVFTINFTKFLEENMIKEEEENSMCVKMNIFENENFKLLHEYFQMIKAKEKLESHSKKAQILTELMIYLNLFQKRMSRFDNENLIKFLGESGIDLEKYKNIENLAEVYEIMTNYQENKALIASTWIQTSEELLKKEERTIDGDHFYYKNLHTYKVTIPFASDINVVFSEESQTDVGDSILFSSDAKGFFIL